MATADRIKGINIVIDGDTTKLTDALKKVNSSLNSSQKALKDVNKLLKLDPTNTDLLRQKQDYLKKSVEDTEKKLQQEKEALEQLRNADGTEDTTEQQRALERQIADTEAQLKSLQGQLSDFGSVGAQKVAAVGEKFQDVGQKMQDVGNSLSKSVTAPILAVGAASVAAFNDVDAGLDIVVTKTGATGDALAEMQDITKSIAGTLPTTFEAAGAAVGEVNTRFGVTGKTLQDLSTQFLKFAEINNVDVSDAVDTVQSAMAAWNLEAKDAPAVLDTLTVASQKTGVSVDKLSSSMTSNKVVLDEMGLSFSDSAMFLAQLETSGLDASVVLAGLKKALANAAQDGKSMDEALAELQDTLANASSDSEAYAAAMELFGAKAGPQLAEAIQSGRLSLDELGTSLQDNVGAVSTTFENTLDAPDRLKVALNNVKLAGADLGASMLTVAGPAIEKLGNGAQKLATWFSGLNDKTKNTIVTVAALAAAVGPVLSIGGKVVSGVGTVLGLAPKLATAFSAVSGAIKAIGVALSANPAGAIIAVIGIVIAGLVALWNNCEGFRNAVTTVFNAIKTAFDAVVQWFSGAVESIGNFFSGVKDGIANFGANVAEKFGAAKDAIVGAWDNVKGKTAEAWGNIKSKVEENGGGIKGVLVTAAQGYIGIWKGAFGVLDQVTGGKLSSALATVQSKAEEIKTACSEKFNAAKDAVVGAWDNVTSKTAEAWGNIKSKVAENGGGIQGILVTAGQAYLSVWTGAFNAIDQVTGGKLSSALSTVQSKVESIKAAFTEKLGAARDKVKEIIEKIKGFFNFTVRLPHIPLPHFSVSPPGWSIGDLVKGKIPSLSVNWYRKAYDNPIVFNRPTVIPTPDGLKGFGDGSGAEVVIGMNRLRQLVANAGGGDTINNYVSVYAAAGQSEDAIADKVIQKLTRQVNRKRFA